MANAVASRLVAPPAVPPWAPLLSLLVCLGVAWTAVAPLGAPRIWEAAGAAAALGGLGGIALQYFLRRRITVQLPMLVAIGIGLWRGGAAVSDGEAPWIVPAQRVRVFATIDAPVETRGTTASLYAHIDRVIDPSGAQAPAGRVLATVPGLAAFRPGQLVEMAGRFEAVDPASTTGSRLARQGVVATIAFPQVVALGAAEENAVTAALHELRTLIEATIQRTLPEPHATLLVGLLVGSAAGMPESLRLALVASGTSHLVVVSGYNISLVAAALASVVRAGRALRIVVPLLGVWGFTLLAGANAPAVRAAIMATVALVMLGSGRGVDALGALALAAAAMLLLDPRLAFDLGFQLSVLATLGLIALQPRVAALVSQLPGRVREPVSTTLAAQIATTPLLAATFHQLSVVAPISNLLAAPIIPFTTFAGAIGVAIVAAFPALAGAVGVFLAVPTTYLLTIFEWTAALPAAIAPVGDVHPAVSVVYGAGLLLWAGSATPEGKDVMQALRSSRLLRQLTTGAGVLCIAGVAASMGVGSTPQPLVVSVLDVGQGDAVFARTPSGRTLLIDGGPNPTALLSQIGRRVGIVERNISVAILTRADSERLAGAVGGAERYPPGLLISPPEDSPSALYHRWQALATGAQSVKVEGGSSMALENGLSVELIPTDPLPAAGETGAPQRTLAVRIVYGEVAMLVAPSLTPEGGRALVRGGWNLRAEALVVPRHGASAGLDPALLAAIQPQIAVIPVGASNRQGLPARETLDALQALSVFRTDLNGTVELRTDGRTLWAQPERGGS